MSPPTDEARKVTVWEFARTNRQMIEDNRAELETVKSYGRRGLGLLFGIFLQLLAGLAGIVYLLVEYAIIQ